MDSRAAPNFSDFRIWHEATRSEPPRVMLLAARQLAFRRPRR
jgi:hypothetical protein